MKRLPLTLAVLLVFTAPVAAGEHSGTDIFAGYSFARVDEVNRHGANLAVGFDLFGPIDGFVDGSTHWASSQSTNLRSLTLMAGPGFRLGRPGATTFFVRVLAGLAQDRTSIGVFDVDISETNNRFGLLAGGGLDIPVARKLALRAQGDYFWKKVTDGGKATGFRASAGLVYRSRARP